MISVLILENQEPGDCAACPLFFRNAGICSWTLRFNDPCPLRRGVPLEGTISVYFRNGSCCKLVAVEE